MEKERVKVIIAGSREVVLQWGFELVGQAMMESGWEGEVGEVVSGRARGVDRLGEKWARERGIPVKEFPANWAEGSGAGFNRNKAMGEYADRLVAIWDGMSHGTGHMIKVMRELGKPVYVKTVPWLQSAGKRG